MHIDADGAPGGSGGSRTVLHVAQPTSAGVPRVVADLVADQVARGWRVVVACPPDGTLPADAAAAGAEVLAWPATRSPGPSTPGEALRLRGLVRRVRPDLLHLHSSKAGLAGRLAVRGAVPTVFQPHAWSFLADAGPVGRAARRWEALAARWCAAVAVVSEAEQRQGERAGVRARWAVVPNGVDVARRAAAAARGREAAREQLGLPAAEWVVCAGRLSRQKGQDLLLDAWPRVAAAVPGARLALVGDGPDADELARRAPAGVVLAGGTSDVDPWLVAADVVALPSRWEAGSLLLLEAMAVGRSVVAGRADGMAEALDGTGAVVDPQDAAALADALVTRLRDPDLRRAEEVATRALAEARHDVHRATARVAALYDDVLRPAART